MFRGMRQKLSWLAAILHALTALVFLRILPAVKQVEEQLAVHHAADRVQLSTVVTAAIVGWLILAMAILLKDYVCRPLTATWANILALISLLGVALILAYKCSTPFHGIAAHTRTGIGPEMHGDLTTLRAGAQCVQPATSPRCHRLRRASA
jgi:hypothetical protein